MKSFWKVFFDDIEKTVKEHSGEILMTTKSGFKVRMI